MAGSRADDIRLQELFTEVQKPFRYIGGEWNQVVKDDRDVDLKFALAFPDVYEIGMSHLGFRILYSSVNAREDTAAERVFCPWPDMASAMRRRRIPLATLETGTVLSRLDVVGFSLQYEMTFTNVLEMLDLGGIPLRSGARGEGDPLVIAGGPVVFNVEPLADFLDLVLVGDAEGLLHEFLDRLRELKLAGASRRDRLVELARIDGVYAPSLYDVAEENGLRIPVPRDGAPYPVRRRIVMDLDAYPFPDRILVPHGEIVHDRVSVELMRGCPVGCRFCQAGYTYRPTRERDPNQVRDTVIRSIRATGYDAFSLASLNTGEYGAVHPLLFDLMGRFEPENVSVSLSSLHASTMTPELAREVRRVRKSGFTIAPEAGTQRLRNVINKNLSEEQILEACRLAFEAGWDLIKLYFMIGLPTETDADVDGLVDLAHEILATGRRATGGKRVAITLSASSFVPKPVTPFQWLGMDRTENLYRKQDRIAARARRGLRFKHHECETSFLEAVFSRGDRRLGPVLERAWRSGARFDGWAEHFRKGAWEDAFRAEGVDPEPYAYADRDPSAPLPWDVIDSRINKQWLALELDRALAEGTLSVCGPADCHGCAPFARDCVKGTVSETTGRPLRGDVPILSTPVAPGPGRPAETGEAPRLVEGEGAASADDASPRYRYRVRFTKEGALRFLGHLDLARAILRGLRRARVPLLYSRGFNPKPKVAFGPALSVGIGSDGEYLDVETTRRLDARSALETINAALPEGIRFLAIREIRADARGLGEIVTAARYRARHADGRDLGPPLAAFLSRDAVPLRRERKGRVHTFDLRREVLSIEPCAPGEVRMTLALGGDGASVRPDEALREIFGDEAACLIVDREDLLAAFQGRRVNPLLAASAHEPHARRAAG